MVDLFIELMSHLSHVKQMTAKQYIPHMNWYCVCKSQEEGYIFTEIPQQRVLAGTEFQTIPY